MAQTDMNVADQSGEDFLVDINNHLEAIATTHSGTSRPSDVFEGQLWIKTDEGSNTWGLYLYDGQEDVRIKTIRTDSHEDRYQSYDSDRLDGEHGTYYNDVPNGTRTVFYQASAPTGYTQVTSVNDRVLRVVDGEGGSTGGDGWDFSGAVNVDGHTLSLSEIPNRTGSLAFTADSDSFALFTDATGPFSISNNTAGSTRSVFRTTEFKPRDRVDFDLGGGGESHSHGVSGDTDWRPNYADVIVCERSK